MKTRTTSTSVPARLLLLALALIAGLFVSGCLGHSRYSNRNRERPERRRRADTVGQSVADTACKYIGTKYVWGGTSPKGFDCSGLVYYAYKQHGISIPRTSKEQANFGKSISKRNLEPGDLVFFGPSSRGPVTHVAMYLGNDTVLHAPTEGYKVQKTPLSRYNNYFQGQYINARRVVD